MTADKSDPRHPHPALTAYHWEPQPQAAAFVQRVVDDFLDKLPEAAAFADRLYRETGNRFADLICEIKLPADDTTRATIQEAGWTGGENYRGIPEFQNPNGLFPAVRLSPHQKGMSIGLKVESVSDFLAANNVRGLIYGTPWMTYRWAQVFLDYGEAEFYVVERHGSPVFNTAADPCDVVAMMEVLESFRLRDRVAYDDGDGQGIDIASDRIDEAIEKVGRDVACDLFFAAEREYWQRRNTAAQFQKARQDRLGIGWANHDHHTYRSSRRHFHRLIALWEKLGFECRERFYPGPEAGWGAQVMEQPVCGIVTFNDVDLSADELKTDFAHEPMQERDSAGGGLGTVGLWCALHGESVLQAGMHHLECTFDFEALREQMEREGGIAIMPKFTDFPHLKQAFTKGERWPVDPKRIDALLAKGLITEHQASEFRANGAIGSHLENLERNDGFKGFNQTGVTEIIRDTDPRRAS